MKQTFLLLLLTFSFTAFAQLEKTINIRTGGSSNATGAGVVPNTATAFVDVSGSNATAEVNNAVKPFSTIQSAINALPFWGGVVRIGIGSFAAPTTLNKSNVSFIGALRPSPNWTVTQSSTSTVSYTTPTALVGGTVIKGGMDFIDLSGIKVKNLGIDVGSDFVSSGGAEMNALGFGRTASSEAANTPSPSYPLTQGIEIDNVTLLCRNAGSLYHALVMENCIDPRVNNVLAIHGTHGIALKTTGGYFTNLTTHLNASDGIIVKANNYSLAKRNVISGFNIHNANAGIIIQNRSNVKMSDLKISNGFIVDCPTGVTTEDNFGQGFSAIVLDGVHVRGSSTAFANSTNYGLVNCYVGDTYTQNLISTNSGGPTPPANEWSFLPQTGGDASTPPYFTTTVVSKTAGVANDAFPNYYAAAKPAGWTEGILFSGTIQKTPGGGLASFLGAPAAQGAAIIGLSITAAAPTTYTELKYGAYAQSDGKIIVIVDGVPTDPGNKTWTTGDYLIVQIDGNGYYSCYKTTDFQSYINIHVGVQANDVAHYPVGVLGGEASISKPRVYPAP